MRFVGFLQAVAFSIVFVATVYWLFTGVIELEFGALCIFACIILLIIQGIAEAAGRIVPRHIGIAQVVCGLASVFWGMTAFEDLWVLVAVGVLLLVRGAGSITTYKEYDKNIQQPPV